MHSSVKHLALAAAATLLFFSTTSASFLQGPSPTTASSSPSATNTCNEIPTGLAPSCWTTLGMTAYLKHWVANSTYNVVVGLDSGRSGSTNPSSTSNNSDTQPPASGQCEGGKPFSTCFLQLMPNYHNDKTNCSKINTGGANGTCPAPRAKDYASSTQNYYVAWNFYSINAYLSTLHSALATLAQTSPSTLTTAALFANPDGTIPYFPPADSINPHPPTALNIDVPLQSLLIRSTAGHVLPSGQNDPFFSLLLEWPAASMYGPETSAEDLATFMQNRVVDVLEGVMRDERVFATVAGNGAFSTEQAGDGLAWVDILEAEYWKGE